MDLHRQISFGTPILILLPERSVTVTEIARYINKIGLVLMFKIFNSD